jgi:mono/diheme cytochrome c family protein
MVGRAAWRAASLLHLKRPRLLLLLFSLLLFFVSVGGILLPGRDSALAAGPQQVVLSPFQRAKAERLLHDRLPCLGCHVLDGVGGHLGPDLSAIGSRLDEQAILQRVSAPQTVQPGTLMPRVLMPAPWRTLIVRYLAERGGVSSGDVLVTAEPMVRILPPRETEPNGEALYGRFCVACHGESGRGDGPNAASLPVAPAAHADGDVMSQRSDDVLFDTIHRGGYIMNRHAFMPAYGETLSSAEIRALVRHIRALCSCVGPAWSSDGANGAQR